MKMKMEKSELNSREKNFFRRKSFSIELDRIKNVGILSRFFEVLFQGEKRDSKNVNLPGGEKERNLSSINSGIHVLKTFFPDKPHSLETKFLDAFLEENLSAKSQ